MNLVQSDRQIFLATPPDQAKSAATWGLPLAHMSYRIGNGPQLFRAEGGQYARGGLMLIGASDCEGEGEVTPFCRQVLRECQTRGFSGVILDAEAEPRGVLSRIITTLSDLLSRRGLRCYLPEQFANFSKGASILISSAISGGSLELRLKDAVARYGANRVVLSLERCAEDFYLPAPQGAGRALSRNELQERITRIEPSVFFSNELCAHYFTYMSRESGAHFILFDDVGSLQKKCDIAHQLGIRQFLMIYEQVEDLLPDLLPTKVSPVR